jgi:WS/DGAT/MGAT family acyltransferase
MSGTEALMWALEKDPALRSDFVNLTILDRAPDLERVRAKARDAVAAIPRLAQRVVAAPLHIAAPEWVDDGDFDLDYHLRAARVPSPGGTRELLDLCATLAEAPFDRARPLWEFTLVEGLEHGRAALVQKIHHTIVDGVGGLRLSMAIVDLERDPGGTVVGDATRAHGAGGARTASLDAVGRAIADATRQAGGAARSGIGGAARLVAHPSAVPESVRSTARLAGSVRRLLHTETARSPLMSERSLRRHFEILQVPLEPAKAAAAALGASLNDLYVTALSAALGRYHERRGVPCAELAVGIPVSLRTRGEVGGNRFAPLRALVPTTATDPAAHVAAVRDALGAARGDALLDAADGLAGVAARFPTSVLVPFSRSQARSLDFAASNLRASPVPLFLAGAAIEATYPLGPRTGTALNVTLLSYCGTMCIGLNIDPAAVTDMPLFMGCLEAAFDELIDVAVAADH